MAKFESTGQALKIAPCPMPGGSAESAARSSSAVTAGRSALFFHTKCSSRRQSSSGHVTENRDGRAANTVRDLAADSEDQRCARQSSPDDAGIDGSGENDADSMRQNDNKERNTNLQERSSHGGEQSTGKRMVGHDTQAYWGREGIDSKGHVYERPNSSTGKSGGKTQRQKSPKACGQNSLVQTPPTAKRRRKTAGSPDQDSGTVQASPDKSQSEQDSEALEGAKGAQGESAQQVLGELGLNDGKGLTRQCPKSLCGKH